MRRWLHDPAPATRSFPCAAPGSSDFPAPHFAPHCSEATIRCNDLHTRPSVREKTWDEYIPRSHNEQALRTTSSEATYIKQDAVRFLAEQKFTETLLQEADLAETSLQHDEAMFQRCMDEIARDMRKIMEDERWVFVSEYLLHKSEQQRLKEDLGLTRVTGDLFSHPPPTRRCKACGEERDRAHIRALRHRPPCEACAAVSPRSSVYLQRVNERCVAGTTGESMHARGDDVKDLCVCERNRGRHCGTRWPRDDGDHVPGLSANEDSSQDDCFRCPRHHACCTSSPPRCCRERLRICPSCHAEAKRTHSEKLPPDSARGLASVGVACRSEAAMLSPRPHGHCCARAVRRPHCPACNTALPRPGVGAHSETANGDAPCGTGAAEQNSWPRNEVDCCEVSGMLSRSSDKCLHVEKPGVTRDMASQEEEDATYLQEKGRLLESDPQGVTSRSCSRFDADEERVLVALIEQRDALLQETVEQGQMRNMPAIVSLNKRIRAFLLSKPGDGAPLVVELSPENDLLAVGATSAEADEQ